MADFSRQIKNSTLPKHGVTQIEKARMERPSHVNPKRVGY